jgi:hypothetical protein
MINAEMWEDEFFTSLTVFERLLWVGLIAACADDQGRLKDNASLIRSKVFPLDDIAINDIDSALHSIQAAGKIARYIAGKVVVYLATMMMLMTKKMLMMMVMVKMILLLLPILFQTSLPLFVFNSLTTTNHRPSKT